VASIVLFAAYHGLGLHQGPVVQHLEAIHGRVPEVERILRSLLIIREHGIEKIK
jgi:hypothetical protein